jgi:hypothetical protein
MAYMQWRKWLSWLAGCGWPPFNGLHISAMWPALAYGSCNGIGWRVALALNGLWRQLR